MNDLEQTEEQVQETLSVEDASPQDSSSLELTPQESPVEEPTTLELPIQEPTTLASHLNDSSAEESVMRETRPARKQSAPRENRKPARVQVPRPQRNPNIFRHIVNISWSGAREPVDDMFWAEADIDGKWIVVTEFEKIRTRKEILDRIIELEASPEKPCLVSFDFNFSYPAQFLNLLKETEKIPDWRGMIAQVREDLKKNMDDGLRLWVERLGRYRESKLEEPRPPDDRERGRSKRFEDWGWDFEKKGMAPHDQRSLAERYRRTDFPLRIPAGANVMSTMNIGFNRLTGRYEFTGNEKRGRGALAGMSMLDRILDVRPHDVAIWPIMPPKPLTIAEVLPWLYTDGITLDAKKLSELIANYEDFGWEIPSHARDMALKSPEAQRALLTLLGMVKTELRADHRRRPIRDYDSSMYDDPQIRLEGWIYGLGYRPRTDSEEKNGQDHTENLPEQENIKPPRKTKKKVVLAEVESPVIAD